MTKAKRCALLVGIDTYLNADAVPAIEDTAVSDTLALRSVLVNKYGFQAQDVKVLLNEDATYQNILTSFKELVDASQLNSTLFYFAGRGSTDQQDNPTILAFDSRHQGVQDILLTDLSQLANQNKIDLISIIDSNWAIDGNRYIKEDETIYPSTRPFIPIFDESQIVSRNDYLLKFPQIGYIFLYSMSIKYKENRPIIVEKKYDSRFTNNSIIFLLDAQKIELPTHQVLKDFCDKNEISFAYDADVLNQTIFSNIILTSKVRDSFFKVEGEPAQQAVLILKRLIEQRNGTAPQELFNLGIAYYILKKYNRSIKALETAIDQVVNNTTTEASTMPPAPYPEAHYWLGRVLYESKQDPARAVSELRRATQESPDNIAAHYYLGKALQALVEQEILTEAERAYQTYLNAGFPLGQKEEVQEFLRSRQDTKSR